MKTGSRVEGVSDDHVVLGPGCCPSFYNSLCDAVDFFAVEYLVNVFVIRVDDHGAYHGKNAPR